MDANRRADSIVMYSIGHSNLSLNRFVDILFRFQIRELVDVRSAPFSRFAPQFNRPNLEYQLGIFGIKYRYAGEYLGGRPQDRTLYREGVELEDRHSYLSAVDYERLAQTEKVQIGLHRLVQLASSSTIAVMCSEENPKLCHRFHLIERALLGRATMLHIRSESGDIRYELMKTTPIQSRID